MQLLNPIWLTALAALGIPVLIHLWNIRPGKTLKVGSISIFEEASPASSRSFKLLDILLLILRCLLLAIVALLLAAPFWQQKADPSAKGWVLIPHKYFGEAYHQYKSKIDSLGKKGYEFHYFDAGFPKQKLEKLLKDSLSAQKTTDDSTNYWLLAAQLDKQIPAATPVEVFTPNTGSHFQNNQPATTHHFTWNTFTPADSVKTWLPTAWVTDNGSIRLAQGTGKPSGVAYQYIDVRNDNNNPLFDVKTADGHTTIALKTSETAQTVSNQLTELAIYTGNNEADANYLRAALEAASRFMLQRVQVKVYHQPNAIPAGVSWLFWLSDAPITAKNAHRVLYYADGKASIYNSWLVNKGDQVHPQLFKSIITENTNEQPLWTDASGHVILGEKQLGEGTFYPFYTRFNPTWNDLVWNDAFPNWLLQLLTPESAISTKNDTRSIDKQQLQPSVTTANQASFKDKPESTNLSYYLWILLAMLFFAERWLAHQNKIKLSNG